MEHAVDRRLCDFPGKVTANCNITNIKRVENALDDYHKAKLRRSIFWKFHQVRRLQFSGQIIDHLLLRLMKSENADELWFRLGDEKVARFSLMEFLLVTGLNAGNEEEVRPNIQRSKRLLNKYFRGKTTVTPVELASTFDECTVMEDKYKLGLVYILETVLRCKHHKTSIDVFCLDVVDDVEVFNAYPWGRRCFMDTLHAFKRTHTIKGSKTDRKYDVYGFPLAVQVWAFEAIPSLANKCAIRKEWTRIPRMLNWQATDIPTAKDVAAILDDPQLEVYTILTPTPEEMENVYIQGVYIPARVPDPIFDPYLVGEEGHSPTAQRSPTLHRASRSPPPPRLSPTPSPVVRRSSRANLGANVSDDLFERLNRQLTSMEHRITSQLMAEVRRVNKKVGQLSKKVDEVIEWVRPYHHTDTMAPETASDRVPVESDRVRDQEVDTEMETRDHPEFATGVRTDMEIEMEIGQPDIETERATDREQVVEKDGVTDGVVIETGRQLDVETEGVTNREPVVETDGVIDRVLMETGGQLNVETEGVPVEEPAVETDGVTDGMVSGGQQSAGETEQLVMEHETGSQPPEVETRGVTEGVVTADVPTVIFTRRKRKNEEMVENTEIVGKRLRVPSAYLSSPFTAGVKRRTFIDGSKIDLFQKVDPSKETEFLKWYSKLGTSVAYLLGSVRMTDAKQWFHDVLTDGKWLADEHVDMAMYLLRQRVAMYPKSFKNQRVIMDFGFKNMLDVAQMMKDSCPQDFECPDYLFDYAHGKSQEFGQPWEGCTHLYIPVLANAHWFATEVNFSEGVVYVYDPDKTCLTQGQLEKNLESVRYFIPILAKSVNINLVDQMRVERVDGTVKQKISGDCGVFTIKFIEFLSIGESAFLVSNDYMPMWRTKLAADMYTQNYDP